MFASTKGATEVIAATLQQTYSKTSRKNQLASFFRLLFQNTFWFSWKPTFFIIRKLNAAANMFASTKGATEVIAATLQQSSSKTSKENQSASFFYNKPTAEVQRKQSASSFRLLFQNGYGFIDFRGSTSRPCKVKLDFVKKLDWKLPNSVWKLPNSVWKLPNSVWQLPNSVWQLPNFVIKSNICYKVNHLL